MANKINSSEDFEKKYNYRVADKCCANCKHSTLEYEGYSTCHHRERFDYGRDDDTRIASYNTMQNHLCDAWEGVRNE